MDKTGFAGYLAFLRDLSETLEKITKVEQEKTQFVRADDLDGLNVSMKQEQALSMTLRSYDQKRTVMLEKMGLQDVPLRNLLSYAPSELKEETRRTVEQVCRQYALFRGAFEVAQDTLECNLHQIDQILQAANSQGESDTGYQETVPQIPSHMRTDFRA